MWKEFKNFIAKGNLVEIAVAFVIGAAFGALVKSFVFDIIMPGVGKLVGNVDFASLYLNLSGTPYESAQAAREAGVAAIYYGAFINVFINFLIIAVVMFLIVQVVMRLRKPKEAPAPTTKECPFCRTQIPIAAPRCPNCTSQLEVSG
ncbi:MAG TPA: large conductance mechanosensitive channel protein MscL [Candidatus Acetothermia bacterium]|nr:large conductance mechanosensitive channel protein MscL [Candidatus Acetothermia bacterium]